MVSMYIDLLFKNRYMFIQSTFEIDLSIVSRLLQLEVKNSEKDLKVENLVAK